jgi:hypothetical protein
MMMQMLGVFAEFEREMIIERTRMGLARKAARGKWTGGTAPFGYRYDAEAQVLLPVPALAAVVQRIFLLYVDRRLGSAAISGLLNDAGQLTSRGHRWTPNRVLGVLRNPTYIGQLPFNGERHQASHDPIIDRQLFERAQQLLAERSESPRPGRQRHRLPADQLAALPALWSRLCRNIRARPRRRLPLLHLLLTSATRHRPLRSGTASRGAAGGGSARRGSGRTG